MTHHPLTRRGLAVLAAITSAALLLAGCSSNPSGDPSASGSAKKVLRVGATGQSYPNSYKENDVLVGYDVEVIEQAAERAGYTVEWTNADFSGLMGQLEAKRLDTVANAVALTSARLAVYNFTDPYTFVGASIVTSEKSAVNELSDLSGKTVAGVLGSNNVKVLEAWSASSGIPITVRTYETRDGAMQDVINNRVDGYVQTRGALLAEIARTNAPLRFVGGDATISQEYVAFPFNKDQAGQQNLADISKALGAMASDGTLTALSKKYFGGEDLSVRPADWDSALPTASPSA